MSCCDKPCANRCDGLIIDVTRSPYVCTRVLAPPAAHQLLFDRRFELVKLHIGHRVAGMAMKLRESLFTACNIAFRERETFPDFASGQQPAARAAINKAKNNRCFMVKIFRLRACLLEANIKIQSHFTPADRLQECATYVPCMTVCLECLNSLQDDFSHLVAWGANAFKMAHRRAHSH